MNAIAKMETTALATMAEGELLDVLQSSLYPGANLNSIKMVLGYCKAAGLDPMQKPVHIVPMWDKHSKSMRDVVMPGVGLYRTQAARSGQLAGISEPDFGPMVEDNLGGVQIRYPEWARVTVSRQLPTGAVAHFAAREFWIENYATAGKDTTAPNAMWRKRPAGQIAKCAQAQALRMAFPEMTGSAPTADEMEGKAMEDGGARDMGMAEVVTPPAPATYPADQFTKNLPTWRAAIAAGKRTADQVIATVESKAPLTDEQKAAIREPDAPPPVTYAQAADRIAAAENIDQLADASAWIARVPNTDQRGELQVMYARREEELGA